jgi:hypothetical protein
VSPYIPFHQLNSLDIQKHLTGFGESSAVRGRNLDHPDARTVLDKLEYIGVRCPEGQMHHLLVSIQILNVISGTHYSQLHELTNDKAFLPIASNSSLPSGI